MGLPNPASVLNGLLGSPDPSPSPGAKQSSVSLSWKTASGTIDSLRFDTITVETNEALLAITSHAVEKGSDITDNAHLSPVTITLEGYISNSPMPENPGMDVMSVQTIPLDIKKKDQQFTLNAGLTAIGDLISPPPANAATVAVGFVGDRAAAMLETLDDLQQKRTFITLHSKFADVENMLLSRRAVSRTVGSGTGAMFNLHLTQVRVVSSLSVDAPEPTELRGEEEEAQGSKGTKPVPPPVQVQVHKSFLKQGVQLLQGQFK